MSNEIANTILTQLGGNKFLAMTGCKNLLTDGKSLSMKLARNKLKATHLKIKLNSMDLYDLVFFKCGKELKEVKRVENVYCDMLVQIYEKETGQYTKL